MDQNGKDDLKTQFVTREGTYRLITLSEYSRPNRVGYQSNQNNPQVRVSLITLPPPNAIAPTTTASSTIDGNAINSTTVQTTTQCGTVTAVATTTLATISNASNLISNSAATTSATTTAKYLPHQSSSGAITSNGSIDAYNSSISQSQQQYQQGSGDRICFNFGKELYVYSYRGIKKNVDLCKPIDKKLYKGTSPSCHDFNVTAAVCDSAPLLVGFTTGQIQLVQPGKRETGRLYNEERLIDKTKVTCLKWLPKSPNLFLASHASGHLYLYNEELPCSPTAPTYQNFKSGDGFTILTCKSKSTRNPLYKWTFNTENCCINEFCFSPCGTMLAIVSQDGFLRVFHYDTMDLLGIARSYFGGFLCVCWSPDSKYIVVGGEDDLVTIWSLHERRVVARGQGHRSWVSVVAFDPFLSFSHCDSTDFSDDDIGTTAAAVISNDCMFNGIGAKSTSNNHGTSSKRSTHSSCRDSLAPDKIGTSYRLGSVGQDTQLCLWDITEDILRQSYEKRHRLGSHDPQRSVDQPTATITNSIDCAKQNDQLSASATTTTTTTATTSTINDQSVASNKLNNSKFVQSNSITTTTNHGNDIVAHCSNNESNKNSSNSKTTTSTPVNVMENCVNTISNCNLNKTSNSNSVQVNQQSDFIQTNIERNDRKNHSGKNDSGLNAFNTLTQRLTNFSFGSDKKSSGSHSNSHKKGFSFSKSTANHVNCLNSSNSNNNGIDEHSTSTSHRNSMSIVQSYDPLKLIGTNACPRFDECPILEPLVCKKIAHERLTALIFREDCFLTACQDGFIYTWARPGFSNIPQQNFSNSPTATPGGTVV